MQDKSKHVKINRGSASISSDSDGTYFQYDWQSGDTDTAGMYFAEFEVTLSNSAVETYPNGGYIDIKVVEDIA